MKIITGILVAASAIPAVGQVTWVQWNSGTGANGHYYAVTPLSQTPEAQQSYAVSLGANLVSINNANEQAFLNSVFGTSTQYWIGFTDTAVEGTWRWLDGSPGTWTASSPGIYANWAPSEPNDYSSGEDHAVMNWNSSGQWNDYFASVTAFGIIETTAIPEPSHVAIVVGAGIIGLGLWRSRKASEVKA